MCLINNTASGTVLNLFFHVYRGRGRREGRERGGGRGGGGRGGGRKRGRGGGNKDGVCYYFYAKKNHFTFLISVCVFDSVITVSY